MHTIRQQTWGSDLGMALGNANLEVHYSQSVVFWTGTNLATRFPAPPPKRSLQKMMECIYPQAEDACSNLSSYRRWQ
jgi:hypothetical protein